MKPDSSELESLIQQAEAIEAAMQLAVRQALEDHKRAGNPIAVCENGTVRWVQPEDIDADGDQAPRSDA